ncbi:head-to-tail stopper [Mycobacterium phage Typha]|uniref:Head-to-tail stopper n=1 Tax=Mycobacterium phage Typha TaxID=2517971 RepID=A0A482J7Y3_9CAUD|nr:head-tail adaptor [Mycobacterium phage Typha]QBP29673.1 head-to-tail stopper [Mycobacterium phage Typha]URM86460.1 head-to-tail stopper [Mycobacterium phage Hilltopfarm]
MPVFREVHPIRHYPFIPDPNGLTDTHGNVIGTVSTDPVPRKVIAIYPNGTPFEANHSIDYVERDVSFLIMLVRKPELYHAQDEVEINGRRFQVQGEGEDLDYRRSPWPNVTKAFGGQVLIRRVG